MKIDVLTTILATFLVLVFALAIYAFIDLRTELTKFKEVCVQSGGIAVFNGRNHECIIKAVR